MAFRLSPATCFVVYRLECDGIAGGPGLIILALGQVRQLVASERDSSVDHNETGERGCGRRMLAEIRR